jgi:hypothetical protein
MKRLEILVSLGVFIASVTLLTALWGHLMGSTIYSKPGVGKAPYNTWPTDKASPW